MSKETLGLLISLITAIIAVIGLVGALITSLRSGSLKQFILEKMEEAEKKYKDIVDKDERAIAKLEYVINAVKEKYKLLALLIDIKKIIEILVKFSKQVNYKK